MRRLLATSAVAAVTILGAGVPAWADNTGTPPGPPDQSGQLDGGTVVCHLDGGGVVVVNKNGTHHNGGADPQASCGVDF